MRAISSFCNSISRDSSCNVTDTKWYNDIKHGMTPGKYLRIYRENKGLTQIQLGEALGGIPRQHISNMENEHRAISLKMARKLSNFLNAPVERFIKEEGANK